MKNNKTEVEQIFFGVIFTVEICTIFFHEYVHTTKDDHVNPPKKIGNADEEFLCDFQAGTVCTEIIKIYLAYYKNSKIYLSNPLLCDTFLATTILAGTTLFSKFVVTKANSARRKYKKTKDKSNIRKINKNAYPRSAERRLAASVGAITALWDVLDHPRESLCSNLIEVYTFLNPDLQLSKEEIFDEIIKISEKQHRLLSREPVAHKGETNTIRQVNQ